jgi:hypothetical protein
MSLGDRFASGDQGSVGARTVRRSHDIWTDPRPLVPNPQSLVEVSR